MGIIRGKIESPREIRPKEITFGGPLRLFYQDSEGVWRDKETNEAYRETTFEELLKENEIIKEQPMKQLSTIAKMAIRSKLKKMEDTHQVMSTYIKSNQDEISEEQMREVQEALNQVQQGIEKLNQQLS